MDASEREKIPMLSAAYFQSDDGSSSTSREFSLRTRSASMPIPMNYLDSSENEHNLVGFTRPLRNERRSPAVQMSGPLYVNHNREFIFQPPQGALQQTTSDPIIERDLSIENKDWHSDDYGGKDAKFQNMIYGHAKGWAKRMCSFLHPYIPGVVNPDAKVVQQWNKFSGVSCLYALFYDPLFFFPLSVQQDYKCIVLDWRLTQTMVVLRTFSDIFYFLHILLQFRLAYVDRKSGGLVDEPKRIARNYLLGYFIIDFFAVLPLPQIILLLILPDSIGGSGASNAKFLLRAAILVQYIPRLYRFLQLPAGSSVPVFIFESAWSKIFVSLPVIVWASHVVGSCWYLFGVQRVHECFRDACHKSNIEQYCMEFIDCGHGNDYQKFTRNQRWESLWESWKNNTDATACFGNGDFDFGIYKTAVKLTTQKSFGTRYVYSLFWGFQQMSTLAGNQVPSYFVWEVLFTMAIVGVGLFLFALLIGSMQNFLQSLESRKLEMSSRWRDAEQWMRHRHLPEELRRQVRASEQFNWVATGGVNEEMLMENLPEDLQREIRRHIFKFVKKVRIFQLLDEPIIDVICERLKTKTYIKDSKILCRGGLVDKMVFIIQGKLESIEEDGNVVLLSEGDVCGEELLTWCLEHSSLNKDGTRIRIPGHGLLSNRGVSCLTNVEAFVLRAADLKEVTSLFARFLRSPRVQRAIRYKSPYQRGLPPRRIKVAWRYRKKRISRGDSSSPPHN